MATEFGISVELTEEGGIRLRPDEQDGWYFMMHASSDLAGPYEVTAMSETDFLLLLVDTEGFFQLTRMDKATPADWDSDQIDDLFELRHVPMNPLFDDALENYDEDGLNNLEEYGYGTHPGKTDTDEDGFPDDEEIDAGSSPLLASEVPVDKNWSPAYAGGLVSALNQRPAADVDGNGGMTVSLVAAILNSRPERDPSASMGMVRSVNISCLNSQSTDDPSANMGTAGTVFVSVENQSGSGG